ncbi:MAG TPA: carboxypeptidase-like regulatory domain-containing protein, partial [Candidatus Solibacter sp.]
MTRIWIGLLVVAAGLGQEPFHIAGTVVNSQTGQPVKGAVVTLRARPQFSGDRSKPPVMVPPREMLTDAAGRFSADAIAAGTLNITAEKPGYVAQYSAGAGEVTVGPSRDGVSIALSPLGVITGRVTDGDGEPVPFASVRAVASELRDGTRIYRQVRSVGTDDQGRYRLWNMMPGEYYIATAGRTGGTQATVSLSLGAGSGGPPAFAPVYFPNAGDRASATPIVIVPGQEFTADLRVRMENSYRIRGTLRGAVPYQAVEVELLRGADDLNATRAVVNSATGRFEVREVVPGSYLLRATQGVRTKPQSRGEIPVQVTGADMSGVVVELVPGVKVSGVVHVPATTAPESPLGMRRRFGGVASVVLEPLDGVERGMPLNARADGQGQFAIEDVTAGRYRLRVMPFGGYVVSAVSGTSDLLHGELVVSAGAAPETIEINLRDDGGSVKASTEENRGGLLLAP